MEMTQAAMEETKLEMAEVQDKMSSSPLKSPSLSEYLWSRTLHVRGFGDEYASKIALADIFSKFGEVTKVQLLAPSGSTDKVANGASNAWALITMAEVSAAEAVLSRPLGRQPLPQMYELQGLSPGDLQRRAEDLGVANEDLDATQDGAVIIDRILQAKAVAVLDDGLSIEDELVVEMFNYRKVRYTPRTDRCLCPNRLPKFT
jgi:hypothetical protein